MTRLILPTILLGALALGGCPDDTPAPGGSDTSVADDTSVTDDTSAVDDTSVADDTSAVDDTSVANDTSVADDTDVSTTDDSAIGDTDAGPECSGPCDCDQGFDCVGGSCALGASPVFCCTKGGCTQDKLCVTPEGIDGLCGVETSELFGGLIINEVLTDGAVDGDPNQDGEVGDPVGDEFIELVNFVNGDVALDGFTLVESDLPTHPRHTFDSNTTLHPNKAIVVFGGGTAPEDTAGATFLVANAADPGTPLGLALDNDGDTLRLLDAAGKLVAVFSYGPGARLPALSDESWTRSPDVTGDFVPHATATGDDTEIFSPGTALDGSSF